MEVDSQSIQYFLSDPSMWKGLIATALGTVAHFINKVSTETEIRQESKAEYAKAYWFGHKKSSILSVIGSIVGFIYLYEQNTTSVLAYVGIGYISDSIFNRAARLANALTSPEVAVEHARAGWQDRREEQARERDQRFGGGGYTGGGFGNGGYRGGGYRDSGFGGDESEYGNKYGNRYGQDHDSDEGNPTYNDRNEDDKPNIPPPSEDDIKR